MNFKEYEKNFISYAKDMGWIDDDINIALEYSYRLWNNELPVIFDQNHLCKILGWNPRYVHAMTNATYKFYREYRIPKRQGDFRIINEPLPDLKSIQRWILKKLLYNIKCNRFAKAYIPKINLKENVRFHRNQNMVVKMDIERFFDSIKEVHVVKVFTKMGYTKSVSVFLAKLCCLDNSLPQGAPTSPYLSNLILNEFDLAISEYCITNEIRYTRYADDMTFSGCSINVGELIRLVKLELKKLGMKINENKTHVLRKNNRQNVTGIVVNEKLQVPKEYRMKIRQEIYYIKKYSLSNHEKFIAETRDNYIYNLLGRINYVLSINAKDKKMIEYKEYIYRHCLE